MVLVIVMMEIGHTLVVVVMLGHILMQIVMRQQEVHMLVQVLGPLQMHSLYKRLLDWYLDNVMLHTHAWCTFCIHMLLANTVVSMCTIMSMCS